MKRVIVCHPDQADALEVAAIIAGVEANGDADSLRVLASSIVPHGTMYVMRDPDELPSQWIAPRCIMQPDDWCSTSLPCALCPNRAGW